MFKLVAFVAVLNYPDIAAKLEEQIRELAKTLVSANDSRNLVVHSAYSESIQGELEPDGTANLKRVLLRTKLNRELAHVLIPSSATTPVESLADLEATINLIEEAFQDLHSLSMKLWPLPANEPVRKSASKPRF